MESQKKFARKFSIEFFPVRTAEAWTQFDETLLVLAKLQPDYFSVTFGAGGGTRNDTFETVSNILQKTDVKAVPHISCVGMSEQDVLAVLGSYEALGVKQLVVLRGDMPSGSMASYSHFSYANELVDFISKQTADRFYINVAAYPEFHPQASSASDDLRNFKRKVEAGADAAITQYFYNSDAYFHFVESCEKLAIDIPILPGVMPITNCAQLSRFSQFCGADIPRWVLKRLQDFGDDRAAIQEFGIDVVTELCDDLLAGGAPGLHFYSMNKHSALQAIWSNLDLGGIDRHNN